MEERHLAVQVVEVVQVLDPLLRESHSAGVGRHDHEVVLEHLGEVVGQQRKSRQVIERHVEETLDLAGVKVDRQHPVRPGCLVEVGDQLGGDRLARRGSSCPGVRRDRTARRP